MSESEMVLKEPCFQATSYLAKTIDIIGLGLNIYLLCSGLKFIYYVLVNRDEMIISLINAMKNIFVGVILNNWKFHCQVACIH